MASPSACGALALVLSAMKDEKIPITSARVHKAIQASVKDVKDPQHIGLIQVEALYQHLNETKNLVDNDADFDISIVTMGQPAPNFTKPLHEREGVRGVYLREPEETSKLYEATCWVKPSFPTTEDTERMYGLDLKLALASSEPWVLTPDYISLPSNGKSSKISM
jgi:tripeptidyl-peptidase-2